MSNVRGGRIQGKKLYSFIFLSFRIGSGYLFLTSCTNISTYIFLQSPCFLLKCASYTNDQVRSQRVALTAHPRTQHLLPAHDCCRLGALGGSARGDCAFGRRIRRYSLNLLFQLQPTTLNYMSNLVFFSFSIMFHNFCIFFFKVGRQRTGGNQYANIFLK